ncbi:carboxymuconolactone decarboxylase family protein [Kitasatospora sp. NPDC097605]|uniref:carboxymuconolactone decarboxylase family protein n=1 Tax=Kitasatospora sp. NPDC097605 TaxID=3157226 RepID=UPI00333325C9
MSPSPARSTSSAGRFSNTALVLEQSTLPKPLRELVQLRVGRLDGCGLCVDIHTKEAAAAGESALRLHLVATWRHSTVFTEAERAALALTEEATVLDRNGVTDATRAGAREHFDDDRLGALVCLIALINAATRMNVVVHQKGGSFEPGMFADPQDRSGD